MKSKKPIPARFLVSKATLWLDYIMTKVIIGGGFLMIVAVLGILVFLLSVTIPLFQSADVEQQHGSTAPTTETQTNGSSWNQAWGMDSTGEVVFCLQNDNKIYFSGKEVATWRSLPLPLLEGTQIAAVQYSPATHSFAIATQNGMVGTIAVDAAITIVEDKVSVGTPSLTASALIPILGDPTEEEKSAPYTGVIEQISYTKADDTLFFVAIANQEGKKQLLVRMVESTSNLDGDGELVPSASFNLTSLLQGAAPVQASINNAGSDLVVLTSANELVYIHYDEDSGEWSTLQTVKSIFPEQEKVTLVRWLFGEMSLVVGGERGNLSILSLHPQRQANGRDLRLFGVTKSFTAMQGAVTQFCSSQINRSFVVASDKHLRLCYGTTADIRWETQELSFTPSQLACNIELHKLLATDAQGGLHFFGVHDKHPEASMHALVGKIWYEGYDAPRWLWQSVGGTDDYESKLSLIPLVFGTIKATLYALLFAVPVGLAAAIYTAHFMPPSVKRIVKPVMETMASLPSVVLGFFGALYLAPRMVDKVPALLAMCILIPALAGLLSWLWVSLPVAWRNRWSNGVEYLIMLPVILGVGWLCWTWLGYAIEQPLVHATQFFMGLWGAGDFQANTFGQLWENGFGLPYQQTNSLVVGFVMGFAVIPVIFTIAEDSLSNVPPSLVAGAEAMGASRWQIVRTVVLPVAAAGIFSALMIGLGRAVGETMIVLMATGNTPIMDWNIFNGMRTLSANIATELPEAAQGSTHYRVLFLGGVVLFVMTFFFNTIAEIIRNRLRKKFTSI